MQLHFAAVTAGDMDAVQVQGICERCGVRVLRTPPSNGEYKIGDTVAVGAIRRLIVRRGDAGAERVLAALREAECAPLTATEIKAIEHLLYDEEFAGRISSGEIIQNLLKRSEYIAQQAKIFSATHRIPLWQALASVLFRDAYRRPSRTGSTAEDEALRQPLSRRA
jgi:hypothetical protein